MGMNETFKAISDPVRRDILQMLKNGRKSAGEIAEQFNLTGATVSYHLSKLKSADLIAEQKCKNFICNMEKMVYNNMDFPSPEEKKQWRCAPWRKQIVANLCVSCTSAAA